MIESEYEKLDFNTDADDPTGSWDEFLQGRQGKVGLSFRRKADFSSTAFAQNVGPFQIVEFDTSDPIDYRRGRRQLVDDGDNSHRLLIPLEGTFCFEQKGQREVFGPGKLCFFHWGRELFMTHDGPIKALIMAVPEESVDRPRAEAAPLALPRERPLVRMLEENTKMLVTCKDWTAADFSVAFSGALDLLDGTLHKPSGTALTSHAVIIERAKRFVEANAHDASVTKETIAAALSISLPLLYKILSQAQLPPPQAMLRAARVKRVHRRLMLAQPIDMDQLAAETGFTSARRMRLAYEKHYGRTPLEERERIFYAGASRNLLRSS